MEQTKTKTSDLLWGGRFTRGLNPIMEKFNSSIEFDKRLYSADITGSIAYAKALEKVNLITEKECESITWTLEKIREEWKCGKFLIKPGDEDIHSANERRLKEIIGSETGGKLHTGRSRNDQVATDMRLWLRDAIHELMQLMLNLIQTFLIRSENEIDVLMPGYTHMQRAQPIRWSHWLMSYSWMFQNDCDRLKSLLNRMNVCPLGCGAIAGNPFNIDRDFLAKSLGFYGCTPNSIQSVGDRDFIAEFNFWASLTAVHLSKLAEDLLLYSTKEFGFVTIADEFSTGSSLMPQKKNADSLELIRGKTGRIIGNCMGLLTVLKGTPSSFNKDLQEDKEGMFDTFDTIKGVIEIAKGTVETLTLSPERCINALSNDMLATDIAYYIVRKGLPFRNAHEIAGKVVAAAELKKCDISELPIETLKEISDKFSDDIMSLWNFEKSVNQYVTKGGTSKVSVNQQIDEMRKWIKEN